MKKRLSKGNAIPFDLYIYNYITVGYIYPYCIIMAWNQTRDLQT